MKTLHKISPGDLTSVRSLVDQKLVRVELAYAGDDNLLFGERIYTPEADLWLHRDLADIVRIAAETLHKQDLRLVLYDGLRTIDAQERMLQTQSVQDNPHWLEEPRLLSPPGAGAHPRGMAIDCSLETLDGTRLEMGTAFDFLAEDPSAEANPAHRAYTEHPQETMDNRKILDESMVNAAKQCEQPLMLLPQEWWDFRFPPDIYELYAPLSDADLPAYMHMCD